MFGLLGTAFALLGLFHVVKPTYADQNTFDFPVNVYEFKTYWYYAPTGTDKNYLQYLDPNVNTMMHNARTVKRDNYAEVLGASAFESTSTSSELNAEAAKIVNLMWARDFLNDMNMYQMSLIHQHYMAAKEQLLKEPITNTVFEDMAFDDPLDRMVVYQWAYHLRQGYESLMSNASKLQSKWRDVVEKINLDAVPTEESE